MLTGEYRYRVNWRGKCILQVQERVMVHIGGGFGEPGLEWRDAKAEDLCAIIKHQERKK